MRVVCLCPVGTERGQRNVPHWASWLPGTQSCVALCAGCASLCLPACLRLGPPSAASAQPMPPRPPATACVWGTSSAPRCLQVRGAGVVAGACWVLCAQSLQAAGVASRSAPGGWSRQPAAHLSHPPTPLSPPLLPLSLPRRQAAQAVPGWQPALPGFRVRRGGGHQDVRRNGGHRTALHHRHSAPAERVVSARGGVVDVLYSRSGTSGAGEAGVLGGGCAPCLACLHVRAFALLRACCLMVCCIALHRCTNFLSPPAPDDSIHA